jgi:hypothetical protein
MTKKQKIKFIILETLALISLFCIFYSLSESIKTILIILPPLLVLFILSCFIKSKKPGLAFSGLLVIIAVYLFIGINLPDFREYKRRLSIFPLSKGTYWIYQGKTKWSIPNKVIEKNLTWKMEVIDTIEKGQYFIAIMKGHPHDLAWYQESKERSDYLIIRKGSNQYYIAFDALMKKILDKAKTNPELLDKLLDDNSLYIDLPLYAGKKYGDPEQLGRPDNYYCWFVESEKQISLENIKGLPSNQTVTQYQLRFYTLPDHMVIKFVKGIGITGYIYVHHGTVSETDQRLIEFYKGVN